MKISKYFNLDKSQYELDFVDIDTTQDIPLFLDPYFLSIRNDNWSINATRALRSFFTHFLTLIRNGLEDQARELFSHLHEPNETCLGLSKGRPSGRGIGTQDADDIFESILRSRAATTGVLEHLEDTRLFVEGVGKDKISDMATNIIRKDLIEYTQQQCRLWDIPLTPNVPTGDMWDKGKRRWTNEYDEMLIVDGKKILLVPKLVVSYTDKHTPDQYAQHFVLNFLQNEHLRMNSALVQTRRLKDGTEKRFVTKQSIKESMRIDKEYLKTFTENHPDVFREFKDRLPERASIKPQEEFAYIDKNTVIDYLIEKLQSIGAGSQEATEYHKTVTGILELVFYPHLMSPIVENEIHSGRKRIDITFDNAAETGFFFRLSNTYKIPSQFIHIECKNYSKDVANPELDQLSGRFSPNRGQFGLMLCRTVNDMDRLLARCADTYSDNRGLIIPLVDDDLIFLLNEAKANREESIDQFLMKRYRSIGLR
jgi:hypothetical protein